MRGGKGFRLAYRPGRGSVGMDGPGKQNWGAGWGLIMEIFSDSPEIAHGLSLWLRLLALATVLPALSLTSGCNLDFLTGGDYTAPVSIQSLSATPAVIDEPGGVVTLSATVGGSPSSWDWKQVSGPTVSLTPESATGAKVDVSGLSVAANTDLTFSLTVSRGDSTASRNVSVLVRPVTIDNALGANGHIGGSIDRIARFDNGGAAWIAYNVGSRLVTTVPGNGDASAPQYRIDLPGVIRDIRIVYQGAQRIALVAMGRFGVAAVDLTVPSAPVRLASAPLNIDDYTGDPSAPYIVPMTVDGGGNDYPDFEISGPGDIVALATNGTTVWLADERFGILRVPLATLLDPGNRNADGSLPIESALFTLDVSEEDVFWGKPTDVRLYEQNGETMLFATLGVAGLAIYDPTTLQKVGGYNLYRDTAMTEDRDYGADLTQEVQQPAATYIDAKTGLPNYLQAQFELATVLRDGGPGDTPWYDLASGDQYFYRALSLDVARFPDPNNASRNRTIAYVAFNDGGLVAVDITGYESATTETPLTGKYLGYLPAVMPAQAEDPSKPDGGGEGLWAFQGTEHFKETGTRRVQVDVSDEEVWLSDHLGGVIAVGHADDPEDYWHGPSTTPYNNDTDGVAGNHNPPWEFVTSFDMTPVGQSGGFNEPLPEWLWESPALLGTGEAGTGHGESLEMMPGTDFSAAGTLDLVLAGQSYGLNYVDITDLSAANMDDRYTILGSIGGVGVHRIDVDGTDTGLVNLSETTGADLGGDYLYISDAPHGVYAFRIIGSDGQFLARPEFMGATLPGLVAATIDGVETYPIHHAKGVLFDPDTESILVPSGGWGLRRGDVSAIESGKSSPSDPALITVRARDLYEHQTSINPGSDLVTGPDRALGVAVKGNLAYVADGTRGLTIYDLSRDPASDPKFLVGNLGANGGGGGGSGGTGTGEGGGTNPGGATPIAEAVALWSDPDTGKEYAFVAENKGGIGVIDVTDPSHPAYVKVFAPYEEQEEGQVGAAEGTGLAIKIMGKYVVLGYGTYGVVVYRISDLIKPVPEGVNPLDLWDRMHGSYDYRPKAVSEFRMEDIPGYQYVEQLDGSVDGLAVNQAGGRDIVWAAYGVGLARIDYTDPAHPVLLNWLDMTGEVVSVSLADGRVYVSLTSGGLRILD